MKLRDISERLARPNNPPRLFEKPWKTSEETLKKYFIISHAHVQYGTYWSTFSLLMQIMYGIMCILYVSQITSQTPRRKCPPLQRTSASWLHCIVVQASCHLGASALGPVTTSQGWCIGWNKKGRLGSTSWRCGWSGATLSEDLRNSSLFKWTGAIRTSPHHFVFFESFERTRVFFNICRNVEQSFLTFNMISAFSRHHH